MCARSGFQESASIVSHPQSPDAVVGCSVHPTGAVLCGCQPAARYCDRCAKTRYGMTRPRIEEVVRDLGAVGNGPAGYSAAREWGVITQVPSSFHVAALWTADPIEGVTQHSRRNRERVSLNAKEIALLELLRAPEVYVETGWNTLARKVRDALTSGEIADDRLCVAAAGERNVTLRKNFGRLRTGLTAVRNRSLWTPIVRSLPSTRSLRSVRTKRCEKSSLPSVSMSAPERTLFEKLPAVHDAAIIDTVRQRNELL